MGHLVSFSPRKGITSLSHMLGKYSCCINIRPLFSEDSANNKEIAFFISIFLNMKTGWKEEEMDIGYPTEVKHVSHIGWDGTSVGGPSWV